MGSERAQVSVIEVGRLETNSFRQALRTYRSARGTKHSPRLNRQDYGLVNSAAEQSASLPPCFFVPSSSPRVLAI